MSLHALLDSYGYLAVFVGTLLEGETILLMAAFAAHGGYLSLSLVMLTALAGGFLGDQFYFYLGKRHGQSLLDRFPSVAARATRVQGLLQRYHMPLIVSIRFMYGLRTVGPVAIGMSGVPWRRFLLLNLIGAALWAVLVSLAGYLMGTTLAWVAKDFRRYEEWVLWAMAGVGLLAWLLHRWLVWRGRRKSHKGK